MELIKEESHFTYRFQQLFVLQRHTNRGVQLRLTWDLASQNTLAYSSILSNNSF
jgi:hypothetical protein